MDQRKRERRSPACDGKIKIKEERVSPARPQRERESSHSRLDQRSKDRSPGRKEKSSGRKHERDRDRSPRARQSRSPHRSDDVRIKREKDDHRQRGNRHDDRRVKRKDERERVQERRRERSHERDEHLHQQQQAEREQYNERRRENRLRQEANSENMAHAFGGEDGEDSDPPAEKEKPNFELSGALVEDTNTFRGVVIKYNEPPEARIPKRRWRLYPFKNDEPLPVMYIHRQSAYLLGRQRKIADIPIDHPSCSKQHAVFQYRLVEHTRADGTTGRRVKPYIIDLGSGNGTFLNNQRIEPQRYYELKEKDVLKFGFSSREYVLLHEFSDTAEVDAKKEEEEEEEDDDEGLDE
ncbi:smad nuclear-interacting protein 1 [Hoplias malabaricus]|uniref:smad nuclear-interacting protein 1 n=1 Tax=Hoplias malabaricus TaxID=27720 RepID=UPI00346258EE